VRKKFKKKKRLEGQKKKRGVEGRILASSGTALVAGVMGDVSW